VLSWKSNVDLDAHLTGPDNASGRFHVYHSKPRFHYDSNSYSSSRSSSDNVTQDTDSVRGSEGPETITVSAVRSGTYRYYVHNFDNAGRPNSMRLYKSKASVKVYHSSLSGGVTKFKAPNMAGDLWTVFEFNSSSGLTRIRTVGSESSSANVDNHGSSLDTTAPSVSSFTLSDTALKAGDNATVTLVFSEAVASFSSAADIMVANGTLAMMTSADNKTWTGTFTPTTNTEDDNNTLSLATSYTDTAGNAGPAETTANYAVDTQVPTISSVTAGWGTYLNATEDDSDGTVTVVTSGAENGQTVTVALNGTNYTGTVSDNSTSVTVAAGRQQLHTDDQCFRCRRQCGYGKYRHLIHLRQNGADARSDNSRTHFDQRQLHPVYLQFQRRGNHQRWRKLQQR